MRLDRFQKEIIFSILWILIYLALVIAANALSDFIRIPNLMNAVMEILFPIAVIIFLKKRNLLSYYGISSLKRLDYKNLLFLIPVVIISLLNFSFGIHINDSWEQILLISVAMLGVGFSEEILFRGFLMKAIMRKNAKAAILLPSILFGMLHMLNLFGGADVLATILQAVYATSFALMCSMFFYRTNNLIPCMICHSLVNITNTFLPTALSVSYQCMGCIAFILPSAFYAWYLYKANKSFIKDL